MPRKKKSAQSPARVPGLPADRGVILNSGVSVADRSMARNETNTSDNWGAGTPNLSESSDIRFSGKDEVVNSMQEMFSHLDPEVIYLVLNECDFRVDNAMDSLLELSVAAEGAAPPPATVSGFELAAALLCGKPQQGETTIVAANGPQALGRKEEVGEDLDMMGTHLTAEFDTLIDQEIETLSTQSPPFDGPFPSLPQQGEHQAPRQALPELLQSSVGQNQRPDGGRDGSGTNTPVSGLSFTGAHVLQKQPALLDFTHLAAESASMTPALDLGSHNRPSAFQAYKKASSHGETSITGAGVSEAFGKNAEGKETLAAPSLFWNMQAPEFHPRTPGPAFITPVVLNPTTWSSRPIPNWFCHSPVQRAPLKPAATIPKSWALPAAPKSQAPFRAFHLEGKVLVLLRGAPGSGKSTLARSILMQNPWGVVLSSDEFFSRDGPYRYNPSLLGDAHDWNHNRAKEAFEKEVSPIIIDNTNSQSWEMRPYVAMAKQHKYRVMFREPDTWWKFKPRELERRTKHGVSKEKIKRMLERYEHHVSVDGVMRSFLKRPELSNSDGMTHPLPETSLSQPLPSEVKPDLVEEPHLSLGSAQGHAHTHAHPPLFSSLPDVSSVGRGLAREGSLGTGSSRSSSLHGSNASLTAHAQTAVADLLDTNALDRELDTFPVTEARASVGESVSQFSWQDRDRVEEEPVAFSESISQRVRRNRARPRQFDGSNEDWAARSDGSSALSRNASQGEGEDEISDVRVVGSGRSCGRGRIRPELLDFVGDWPSEGLGQREQRLKMGRGNETQEDGKGSVQDESQRTKMADGVEQNKNEFQKLLDLLQISASSSQKQASLSACSSVDLALRFSSEDLSQDPESGYQGTRSPSLSSGEGLDQKAGRDTMPELLDCVTDWILSDITPVRDTPQSPATMASPPPTPAQTNVFSPDRGAEQQSKELEEQGSSSRGRRDPGSACQKPEMPGAAGRAEAVSGGSQERRLRQSRRSGKQCKLALTFTNNSPTSPRPQPESPQALPRATPVALETPVPTPPCASRAVQTDPRDFALLWRLDCRQQTDAGADHPEVRVLSVNCSHIQPEPSSVPEPPDHQEVPYRVGHDKGTQVEEQELGSGSSDKIRDLQILRRHFKLVSFDMLEDLYDKCHLDMQWTTNLLLDSGEELFRDDDDDDDDNDWSQVEEAGEEHRTQGSGTDSEADSPNDHAEKDTPEGFGAEQLAAVRDFKNQGVEAAAGFGETGIRLNHEEAPALGEPAVPDRCSSGSEEWAPVAKEDFMNTLFEPEERSSSQPLDSGEAEPVGEQEGGSEGQIDDPRQGLDTDRPASTTPAWEEGAVGVVLEEERSEEAGDLLSTDVVTQNLLSQLAEMSKRDKEEEQREKESVRERAGLAKQDNTPVNIQSLELKLPTELAFQLSELFGPVGIDPGALTSEDCSVRIDLNLARLLHQKWKETIQEHRRRQEALSYHLLQESSAHWGESQMVKGGPRDGACAPHFLIDTDGFTSLGQSESAESFPFMDHWNAPQSHVSLRDIMLEEQALQEHMKKFRESRAEGRRDGATLVKEQQLYSLFPDIDRHFLNDMFKDYNYSLEQTTQFLRSLLDEGPVRTVVAQDVAPPKDTQRATSNERRRKGKEVAAPVAEFQDTEDPEYEDFRTEATLYRQKQQECFSKAAEAYRQGMKDVAGYYAQQGHLHGQKMKEANDRAAVQIFERVNGTLLPQDSLDLHGLHVDEALYHLERVLEGKAAEWQEGRCKPQLSVITGRGNHSQGGVARIRPAVIDYLTNHDYTFTEPKCGVVLVNLH
ncbi:hypothetical protein AAFF_G00180010 [Aldrovandia affinis]|uniref:NEDD4-binding protein 2 n=1 Tax=Aldrovandia affinis TaxID=143900 RepID=A0AAD7WVE3_9TELE|nr:hypothetical protein AAFF_G00180010 [Aldrovandia affinis]